jgi:acetylornithine/N-succinyldiaminopimelate aminotransferase
VLAAPVAADVAARCREAHLVLNAVAPDVLRIAPPLTISAAEVETAMGILADAIAAAVPTGTGHTRKKADA